MESRSSRMSSSPGATEATGSRSGDQRLWPRSGCSLSGREGSSVIRTRGLNPAALGGDQYGLGAVDRAELGIRVVQVGADRARGEVELVGDLLVDLALGQALEHLDLSRGERAGVDVPLLLAVALRQLVHHGAELAGVHVDRLGRGEQLLGVDGLRVVVVGEHVREANKRGLALGVLGVMALDRRR